MWENADVDASRRADETAHRTTEYACPQVPFDAVADEDLSDGVGAGVLDDRFNWIVAFEHLDMSAFGASFFNAALDGRAIRGGKILLFDVNSQHIAVKAGSIFARGRDHSVEIRARSQANEEPFVRAPGLFHTMLMKISLQTGVNHLGGKHEGHFAKGGETFRSGFGGSINNDEFVGSVEKFAGNGLCYVLAGHAFDS